MNQKLMNFIQELLLSNTHFTVTSARRTVAQNDACGGANNSQHIHGEAIDIKAYGSTSYNQLLNLIHFYADTEEYSCGFDQLIIYPTFFHVSFGSRNRRQIIDHR